MTAPAIARARRPSRQVRTEPFRILVASDGDEASVGALRVAAALARRRSAAVHALIVATPFPHTVPSEIAVAPPVMLEDDSRRGALELLRDQLATVRGTGGWTMRATTGFAADAILDAADRWPASLIVLGAGEHGLKRRLVGGETAVKVAMRAQFPVLAVPGETTELPRHALVGVDFSDESIAAATLAATMLGVNGTLTLLYASPLISDEPEPGSLTDLYTTGARDRLAEVAADIHRRTKRHVDSRVATGGIVERLLEASEAGECDLIALGGHESSFLERLLAGNVRADVMRSAACSVLVVPEPRAR